MPLAHWNHDPGRLRATLDWIDSRLGIIRSLSGVPLAAPEPRFWLYMCDLARIPSGTSFSVEHFGAAGTSIDPGQALQRALGEAIERYSALASSSSFTPIRLLAGEGTALQWPRCHVDESAPMAFKDIPRDVPLTHTFVYRAMDNVRLAVPAGYVHLGFWPVAPEPPITLPISTGLAFHTHQHLALWAGLCEVIERDAFMQMWWTQRTPIRIKANLYDVHFDLAERMSRLAAANLQPYLFDISTDVPVKVVICLLRSDHYPYWTVGAGASADPVFACTKSIDEAVSIRISTRGTRTEPFKFSSFSWVRQLDDHARLYASWKNTTAFDFMVKESTPAIPWNDYVQSELWEPPADMDGFMAIARNMFAQGLTVLWADVSTDEATDLGHVVKVIVPEMVPLSQDHNARWLATKRLGIRELRHANHYPHPFS